MGHHRHGEDGRDRHGAGRRFGAPRNGDRRDGENHEGGERDRIVLARQGQKRRGQKIDTERKCREAIDFARRRLRTKQQTANQERRGQHETGKRAEHMGAERRDRKHIGARERPQRAQHNRRDGKPTPHAAARQRERGRGDDCDVDVQRPVIRLGARHERRRQISADDAKTRERRTVQQRGRQGEQRHDAEQNECDWRRQESVKRVGGVHRGVSHRGACCGQNARNIRRRQAGQSRQVLLPPRPFAHGDQGSASKAPSKMRTPGPMSPCWIV